MSSPRKQPGAGQQLPFVQAMRKGAQLLQAGRASEALPYLLQAHMQRPNNTDAAINLGSAYMMLNQYRRAVYILEEAANLEPENSKIWINLGAACLGNPVLARAKSQARAIVAFEKALELDPAAPSVNYNLGLIYRDQAKLATAMEQFRRAAAVNPFDRDARRLLQKLQHFVNGQAEQESSSNGNSHG